MSARSRGIPRHGTPSDSGDEGPRARSRGGSPRPRPPVRYTLPPDDPPHLDMAIIRVTPSGRYAAHRIESLYHSDRREYPLSRRGHMRLDFPVHPRDSAALFANARIRRPDRWGWKYLTPPGGLEATTRAKLMQKFPHCRRPAVRIPPGAGGPIVGKSLLMTDVELR